MELKLDGIDTRRLRVINKWNKEFKNFSINENGREVYYTNKDGEYICYNKKDGRVDCEKLLQLGFVYKDKLGNFKLTSLYDKKLSKDFNLTNAQKIFLEKYLKSVDNTYSIYLIKEFNDKENSEYEYILGYEKYPDGTLSYKDVGKSFGLEKISKRTADTLIRKDIFVKIRYNEKRIFYKFLDKEGNIK